MAEHWPWLKFQCIGRVHSLPPQYGVHALIPWHVLAAGLIVISLLLSYGLVEIPRFVWKTSEPEVRLRYCCHRQEALSSQLGAACTAQSQVSFNRQRFSYAMQVYAALQPMLLQPRR